MQNSLPLRLKSEASACVSLRIARDTLQFDSPSPYARLVNYVLQDLDKIIVLSNRALVVKTLTPWVRYSQFLDVDQLDQISIALNEIHGCLDEIRSAVIAADDTILVGASTRKITEEFIDRLCDLMQDIVALYFASPRQEHGDFSAKSDLMQSWMGCAEAGVVNEVATTRYRELMSRMKPEAIRLNLAEEGGLEVVP